MDYEREKESIRDIAESKDRTAERCESSCPAKSKCNMSNNYIESLTNDTIAAIRAAADEINKSNSGIRIPPCSIDVSFSTRRIDHPFLTDITFVIPCELYDTEENKPQSEEDGGWKAEGDGGWVNSQSEKE